MEEGELMLLASVIKDKQKAVADARAARVAAELKAWETIDFKEEKLTLAKQKEIRVKYEVAPQTLDLRDAEAELAYSERIYDIGFTGYAHKN